MLSSTPRSVECQQLRDHKGGDGTARRSHGCHSSDSSVVGLRCGGYAVTALVFR